MKDLSGAPTSSYCKLSWAKENKRNTIQNYWMIEGALFSRYAASKSEEESAKKHRQFRGFHSIHVYARDIEHEHINMSHQQKLTLEER